PVGGLRAPGRRGDGGRGAGGHLGRHRHRGAGRGRRRPGGRPHRRRRHRRRAGRGARRRRPGRPPAGRGAGAGRGVDLGRDGGAHGRRLPGGGRDVRRVGCNLLWLVPGRVGGTETATVALLRQIAAHPPDDLELTLYALDAFGHAYPDVVRAFPTRLVPITGRVRPLRVLTENTWLANATRDGLDLVHHMGGVLPVVRGTRGVVTVHDLQPFDMPDNFEPVKRVYLQRSIPRSVRRAAAVIAPTEFVRRGIVERFDGRSAGRPGRSHVAPGGVGPPTPEVSVAEVQPRYGLPRRWFVYPSFTWNHKNHETLLRAFAVVAAREQDVALVLTGGEGP